MRRLHVVVIATCVSACSGGGGSDDGGPVDAGKPLDAGLSDAGTPDSGTPDAGTGDAGTPDAGAADSGVADAGVPDAGPCGPLTSTLTRCLPLNPVLKSWRPGVDGGFGWTSADPTVMFDDEDGLWKAWFSSLFVAACDSSLTDPDRNHIDIMYAQSPDGFAWTVQAEPVLRSHVNVGDWDFNTVETPTVLKVPGNNADQRFVLIYSGANSEKYPDGGYVLPRIAGQFAPWELGLAFSTDGRHFTRLPANQSPYASTSLPFGSKEGLVLYAGFAFPNFPTAIYGSLTDPELLQIGDTFHLFFSSVGTDVQGTPIISGQNVAYGISYATSTDLMHWTVNAANPVIVGAGQPTALTGDAGFDLYFSLDNDTDLTNANIPSAVFPTLGFFHATSSDGVAWQTPASRELSWDRTLADENLGMLNGPAVVRHGDELRLYYAAFTDAGVPTGSCALVKPANLVPGVQVLNVARKRVP